MDSSVSFVGAGSGSTIINANNIDKAFTVNSGVVNGFAPYDVYSSGLTIENGDDKNDPNSSQCAGECDFYGGNMDSDSAGPGTDWTRTFSTLTCTTSVVAGPDSTYNSIFLTVSIPASDAGLYINTVTVGGGGETNTSNDTNANTTNVIGAPTIAEACNPTSVAPGANSVVTCTSAIPAPTRSP